MDFIPDKYKERCKEVFWKVVAAVAAILAIIGLIYNLYTYYVPLERETKKIVNPATSKEDDLTEISQKLSEILDETRNLKNRVDEKRMKDLKIMKFGINNYELQDWELSLSGGNSLNLSMGDKVLVVNNSSENKQSAHFKVKFIRDDSGNDGNTEMFYINSKSAVFLGINSPEQIGVFKLSVEKINQ